ncbi:MAG: glucose-1-phosphate thymidylyltransferase RfbA [Proteobacteria bacterium]|uniref:Glucose-1-phosphate thymidylyltransferase n=1 Tax=Candidatus Enterousia excrementavium TaxID=2840789 RepID=A0A940IAP5_9PROT|nr:glucose-1-phosphate thymidylyltransferase RfbA [Candidatus Enterousia excrementavium]
MKGIILAGGSGTRLYPLTKTTSKQLLPVYDKPMIYYPMSTLMQFDIRDVLIISTPQDTPNIERLFGNGNTLGMHIHYAIQEKPQGIAQAFTIGAQFINGQDVCLILGDNIFHMGGQLPWFRKTVNKNQGKRATIFAYHVSDPERFGVVEFDDKLNAVSIEEKPKNPKSNFASVGLYFYPGDVVEKAKSLKPSARGEYEITDLNNLYLAEHRMSVVPMLRGNAWLDAGTPKSLIDSSNFVQIIEERQGLKIACIEEIAYRRNFINKTQLNNIINTLKDCEYKKYLIKVSKETKHKLY